MLEPVAGPRGSAEDYGMAHGHDQASIRLIERETEPPADRPAEVEMRGQYLEQPAPLEGSVLGLRPGETATARALQLSAQVESLKQENKQLKAEVERLEQELAKKKNELQEVTLALNQLNQQAAATRRQLLQWQSELADLRERLEADRQQYLQMLRNTVTLLESLVGKGAESGQRSEKLDSGQNQSAEQSDQTAAFEKALSKPKAAGRSFATLQVGISEAAAGRSGKGRQGGKPAPPVSSEVTFPAADRKHARWSKSEDTGTAEASWPAASAGGVTAHNYAGEELQWRTAKKRQGGEP